MICWYYPRCYEVGPSSEIYVRRWLQVTFPMKWDVEVTEAKGVRIKRTYRFGLELEYMGLQVANVE